MTRCTERFDTEPGGSNDESSSTVCAAGPRLHDPVRAVRRVKRIQRRTVPESVPAFLRDFHPVLRRVLAARAIDRDGDLDHSLARLLPPDGLLDIDRAAALLDDAIDSSSRIVCSFTSRRVCDRLCQERTRPNTESAKAMRQMTSLGPVVTRSFLM